MIISNFGDNYSSNAVKAKVELYEGSTLAVTCTCSDVLADFTISREGEMGKFFGFGVCHKLEMKLIDLEKVLRIYPGYDTKLYLGGGAIWDNPYPDLEVKEVKVDKKSGDITLTAYDALYYASEHTFNELGLGTSYTPRQLAQAIADVLGVSLYPMVSDLFDRYYEGNYEDKENLRTILNHIAEVTQTIYYIDNENRIRFKKLITTSVSEYHRKDYYEFETESSKVLRGICSATELGENLTAVNENITDGVIQYIRNNALWELRDDVETLLTAAVDNISGLELTQFALDWSGDYRLEVGDCITIYYDEDTTKVYVLSDVIKYDGTISEVTTWEYVNSSETDSNPVGIGDAIYQTFAKVDKIEKNITLYVSEEVNKVLEPELDYIDDKFGQIQNIANSADSKATVNEEKIAQLELTTENITADVTNIKATNEGQDTRIGQIEVTASSVNTKVTNIEQNITNKVDSLSTEVETLTKEVNLAVTEDEVEIVIEKTLQEGVEKVVTATKKYSFDDTGLNVSSASSSISTTITEDGMRIYRSAAEVLTADNQGVKAEDLHATTYLIIGNNSRLEDWANDRTACFWIGGN